MKNKYLQIRIDEVKRAISNFEDSSNESDSHSWDWDCEESEQQYQIDLRDMVSFRKMQLVESMKYLIKDLE